MRGNEFVAIVDLDDIMFAKRGTLLEYASKIPYKVSQVQVSWTMFGSSGFEAARINNEELHMADEWTRATVEYEVHRTNERSQGISSSLRAFQLWRNHPRRRERASQSYAIQSREFSASVKMTRGDVDTANSDNVRTWNYVKSYDSHDFEDTSLRDKVYA